MSLVQDTICELVSQSRKFVVDVILDYKLLCVCCTAYELLQDVAVVFM